MCSSSGNSIHMFQKWQLSFASYLFHIISCRCIPLLCMGHWSSAMLIAKVNKHCQFFFKSHFEHCQNFPFYGYYCVRILYTIIILYDYIIVILFSGERMVPVCRQNVLWRCSRQRSMSSRTEIATSRTTIGSEIASENRTLASLWDCGQRRRCITWRGEHWAIAVVTRTKLYSTYHAANDVNFKQKAQQCICYIRSPVIKLIGSCG